MNWNKREKVQSDIAVLKQEHSLLEVEKEGI